MFVKYVVREADTLPRIAERFHTTLEDLRRWNQHLIYSGDVALTTGTVLTICGSSEAALTKGDDPTLSGGYIEPGSASTVNESIAPEAGSLPVDRVVPVHVPHEHGVPEMDTRYRMYGLPTVTFDGYRGVWILGLPVMTYPIAGTVGTNPVWHNEPIDPTHLPPPPGHGPFSVAGNASFKHNFVVKDQGFPQVTKRVTWDVYDEESTATWVSSSMGRSSDHSRMPRPSEALYDEDSSLYGAPSFYSLTFESNSMDEWSEPMLDEESPSR